MASLPDGGPDPSPARQLPPLAALRAFAVAARNGSFTRAAEELCVTQGAVSRQVLQLEAFYGQPLFLRQARGLVLTEAGEVLAATAHEAFDQIVRTTRLLRRRLDAPELKFMVPTCVMLWAMPILMRFQRQHPGTRLSVNTTISHDFESSRYDAGIVYVRLDSPPASGRLLFAERLTPVCSPRLIEGSGALKEPADLRDQVLLHARPDHMDWRQWLDHAGLTDPDPATGLDFQTLDLSNAAAAEGYGVALGDRIIAQAAINGGRLCAPLGIDVSTGFGYALAWREDQATRPEMTLLLARFAAEVGS